MDDENACRNSLAFLSRPDATTDLSDASSNESPDAEEPDTVAADGPSGTLMCADRCCVNGSCLEFPPRLSQGLLLWADRTSLGQPGSILQAWLDRSPKSNDIVPLGTPPRVSLDLVGPLAEIDDPAMVLATKNKVLPSLGIEDFTILVLARCDAIAPTSCVFDQTGGVRPTRTGVRIFCNGTGAPLIPNGTVPNRAVLEVNDDALIQFPDGTIVSPRTDLPGGLHLYGARRVEGRRIQLRVDGIVDKEIEIPASTNLMNAAPLFVGSCVPPTPPYTTFHGGLGAAIVVRGPMADDEVKALEDFLLGTMGP